MKLRYILFSSIIIAAVFCVRIPTTSAAEVSLTCSGANTNQCNANCTATASDSDTSSSYIDYIYRESPIAWDDYVTWGAVVNNTAVMLGNYGVSQCGGGGAGSASVYTNDMTYLLPAGTQNGGNNVSVVMTAFQKRTTDVNAYHGTVTFDIHHVYCTAGQIVVSSNCQTVTATLTARLHDPACTGSCAIDVYWAFQPFGVGGPSLDNDVKLYENGAFWQGETALGGNVTTNPMPVGTYNFCVHGFDGFANETGDLSCQSVAVPAVVAKTATVSVSTNTINLSSGTPSGSDNVINTTTNGGTFSTTHVLSVLSGTPVSFAQHVSITYPDSQTVPANGNLPFSVAVDANSPAGTADIQISPTGQGGTTITNPTPQQDVTVTYTPAGTPPPPTSSTCSPANQTIGQNLQVIFTGGASGSTWYASGASPSSGSGSAFVTYFPNGGFYTVQLNNSGTLSLCSVLVTANTPPPVPPPPPTALTCSPATQQAAYYSPNGYNGWQVSFGASGGNPHSLWSWTNSAGWSPGTGSGESYTLIGHGYVSDVTATVTDGTQTANCCFGSGGLADDCAVEYTPPPPPPASALSVATDGYVDNDSGLVLGSFAPSISGLAPLNGVDLLYTTPGSANQYGSSVSFSCGDSSTPVSVNTSYSSQVASLDQCNYSTPGTYTATATTHRTYTVYGNVCYSADAPGCAGTTASAQVVVTAPIDFSLTQAAWTIPVNTPRYRADYDYNNDGVLNMLDADQLFTWAGNGTACPSGKTCDINSTGGFNTGDALAYGTYLQTLTMYNNSFNQTATISLSSNSGASIAMSQTGAPSGSAFSTSPVQVPAHGAGTSLFTVPSSAPVGSYTVIPSGTAGGNTLHSPNLFLTVLPAVSCPAGTVTLTPSSIGIGQTATASAPSGFAGGTFASSNSGVASVSGSTVTGRSAGTANISGSGWSNVNGATNCSLSTAGVGTPIIVNNVVNGQCGTANKTYPQGATSYGLDTYCQSGNPSSSPGFPSAGNSATWICNGTGGGTNSPTCTAFNPASQYSVVVTKINPSGGSVTSAPVGIDCGNTCSATFAKDTNVTLTATPSSSYWAFSGWSGACSGTGQCVLDVTSAKNVIATFAPRGLNYQEF